MIGPEIFRAVGAETSTHLQARELLARVDTQHEKVLVVGEPHVEARLMLLDEVVLEEERFLLVVGDDRLDVTEQAIEQSDESASVAAAAQK